MTNNAIQAVLWDMDGVIVDTAVPHFQSWRFAFQKCKIDFTWEQFQQIFGQRNDTIIRKILGVDVTPDQIESISVDKEEFFREMVKRNIQPFPGVIALLRALQENGVSSAVASSAPLENIRVILNGLGIEKYFQAWVYGQEVSEGKPSPKIFQLAAQRLKADPCGCVVIEDAAAGVTAAKRAGMVCVAVTNTLPAGALTGADLIVDSLEKVHFKDLNRLFKNR
jgi:beta-phosphoglucomutase family hydrolase